MAGRQSKCLRHGRTLALVRGYLSGFLLDSPSAVNSCGFGITPRVETNARIFLLPDYH